MNKLLKVFACAAALLLLLAACGSNGLRAQVERDLTEFAAQFGGELESAEIGKKIKNGKTSCTVNASVSILKNGLRYSGVVSMAYEKMEKSWVTLYSDWLTSYTVVPAQGVSEETIKEALRNFPLDEDDRIKQDQISTIHIQQQNTDLEEQRDHAICEVVLENGISTRRGEISLNFIFKDEQWSPAAILRNSQADFQVQYVEGLEPPIPTEEDVIGKMVSNMDFDLRKSENLSSFQIEEAVPLLAGYLVEYPVYATFSSSIMDAHMAGVVRYQFQESGGWKETDASFEIAEFDYTKMLGKWEGTYHKGFTTFPVSFSITEIKDGSMLCEGTVDTVSGTFSAQVKPSFGGLYLRYFPISLSSSINPGYFFSHSEQRINFDEGFLCTENLFSSAQSYSSIIRRVS